MPLVRKISKALGKFKDLILSEVKIQDLLKKNEEIQIILDIIDEVTNYTDEKLFALSALEINNCLNKKFNIRPGALLTTKIRINHTLRECELEAFSKGNSVIWTPIKEKRIMLYLGTHKESAQQTIFYKVLIDDQIHFIFAWNNDEPYSSLFDDFTKKFS